MLFTDHSEIVIHSAAAQTHYQLDANNLPTALRLIKSLLYWILDISGCLMTSLHTQSITWA